MWIWAAPEWLWLLLLPLGVGWWAQRRPARQLALPHPHAAWLAEEAPRRPPWSSARVSWLLGCGLLIVALARPQWVEPSELAYSGRDFLLALDVSGSMRAVEGAGVSRLDALKQGVDGFLAARTGDRAGVIVFGDEAYTLVPVTTDMNLLRALLREVRAGMAGERTALGDALALAVARLQDQAAQARIVILLTDGTNTAGTVSPSAALALARAHGVRVYTVAIGGGGEVWFPRGPREAPELTRLPVDEALLKELAAGSGGKYYAAPAVDALRAIMADIERSEPLRLTRRTLAAQEWFVVPAMGGLLCLAAAWWRGRLSVLPW